MKGLERIKNDEENKRRSSLKRQEAEKLAVKDRRLKNLKLEDTERKRFSGR